MDVKGYRCLTLSLKWFLVVLLLHLANVRAANGLAYITECSMRHLNFTLTETPGGSVVYYSQAACMDNNGSCVDGEYEPGFEVVPSRTYQVSLDTSCSLSNKLSPNGFGLCTLQISTTDVLAEMAGIAFLESCTLPPLSSVVSSASMPTTEVGQASMISKPVSVVSSAVSNAPMPTPTPGEDQLSTLPVLVPILTVTAFLLMAILLIVAIVALIMWMRNSKIKSQGVAFEQKDVLKMSNSGFLSFEGDTHQEETIHEP